MSFQIETKKIQWNQQAKLADYTYYEVTSGGKTYAILTTPCVKTRDIWLNFSGKEVIVVHPIRSISGNVEIICDRLINLSGILAKKTISIETKQGPVDNIFSYGLLSSEEESEEKKYLPSANFLFEYAMTRNNPTVFREAIQRFNVDSHYLTRGIRSGVVVDGSGDQSGVALSS